MQKILTLILYSYYSYFMWMTCYQAGKKFNLPGVTLYQRAKRVPRDVFYQEVKGTVGIDTSNQMWIAYVEDYRIKNNFKDLDSKLLKKLVNATVETIKEVFSPTDDKLDDILTKINQKFAKDD